MEHKTQKLLERAEKIMGKDADILILSHIDGKCGAVTHGSTENIAQAIFSCIHQPNNPIGKVIYRIIKLNVMNILNNPSPFAGDLIDAINSILPDPDEEN